jgi:mannose-6-phosphate isomerase-like protein (cupin superfamily)
MKTSYQTIPAYVTKDGSEIRELMHPAVHGNARQSLAEAIIQPGQKTQLHRHPMSEELYHVTQGTGIMSLGETGLRIGTGDTVLIAPGVAHCVQATGESPLHILCCCSPAYSDDDTQML